MAFPGLNYGDPATGYPPANVAPSLGHPIA
jgi:hypothetical protein